MRVLFRVFIVALSLLHNPSHTQAQERYFPPLALDPFSDHWFSSHLHALLEPSLFKKSGDQSTYRFTWLRTFHRPYAFRVTVAANNTATFTMKLSSGAGGYDPGQLIEERSYPLAGEDAQSVIAAARPLERCETPAQKNMMDGSRWVFEFKQGETYCVVHEQSPTVGPLYEFGRLLIEIAEIEIPDDAFY